MVLTVITTNNNNNNSDVIEYFETFFQGWLLRQEEFFNELVLRSSSDDEENNEPTTHRDDDLIARVIIHYHEYYAAKSQIIKQDVFSVLSPVWFTSYERSFLWIGGFKPGLAFKIAASSSSGLELAEEQGRRMERLKEEIVAEERELMAEFFRAQEGLLALTRRLVNGQINEVEAEIERLRASMEALVECADCLRGKTAIKVMEILSSAQTVRFLAAAAQLQLTIRRWGLQRDGRRPTTDL